MGNELQTCLFRRIICVLAVIGAVLPGNLPAQDNFTYVVTNGEVTITGLIALPEDSAIPSSIGGLPVTAIGDLAFYVPGGPLTYGQIQKIVIPRSVKRIGAGAFVFCTELASITISNGLEDIGDDAFEYCTSLTNLDFPNTVTNIGYWAFGDCFNLTNLVIPNSVTQIGGAIFGECSQITNILVDASNPNFVCDHGVLFNRSMTMLVEYPPGLTNDYVIPEGVTTVHTGAFSSCLMSSVRIPNSVSQIEAVAFSSCPNLIGVNIPNSVDDRKRSLRLE